MHALKRPCLASYRRCALGLLTPPARIAAAFLLATLAGCAGSPVKDLGGGKHSVSACSDSGLTNPQVNAVRAADDYCGKFNEVSVVDRFEPEACAKGSTAATAVIFSCR